MDYKNSSWKILKYKLRTAGVRDTLWMAYLRLSEAALFHLSRSFPSMAFSPRSIQIEVTTRCNLKCGFCEISFWTEKPADLQFDDFQKMLAHLPKLKLVDLTGLGEALMNRDFFRIVELAKSRGIRVFVNDNFTMMTEKVARRLVELGVERITLSLDAASKEAFEAIRVGANFEKVIANARRLIQVRNEMGKRKPEVRMNCVVCSTTYSEAPALVELAHDMGIRMVHFAKVKTAEPTMNLDPAGVEREMHEKLQQASARARELGVAVTWDLFPPRAPVQHCDRIMNRNFVTRDGYIHPCCLKNETGDRQAQNERGLGNLLNDSYAKIWKSNRFAQVRAKMRKGILPHACYTCPVHDGNPDPDVPTNGSKLVELKLT